MAACSHVIATCKEVAPRGIFVHYCDARKGVLWATTLASSMSGQLYFYVLFILSVADLKTNSPYSHKALHGNFDCVVPFVCRQSTP
jgi:hypothetical protein